MTANHGIIPTNSISVRDADAVANNLPPVARATLDHFIAKFETAQAESDVRYNEGTRHVEQLNAATEAKRNYERSMEDVESKFRVDPATNATWQRLTQDEERARKRLKDHRAKNKSGGEPYFHPSIVIQWATQNCRKTMVEDQSPLPKPLAKFADDPAAGIDAARAIIAKADDGIRAVFAAVSPANEGAQRFMMMFDTQKTSYDWRSLVSVRESKGRVVDAPAPLPPPGIVADALREFVALHVDKQLAAVVTRAREKGHAVLSKGERTKRLNKLRAERDAAEAAEGFFLRKLIVAGEAPWIRPQMHPAALLGVTRDESAEFEPMPATFQEFPSGTPASSIRMN